MALQVGNLDDQVFDIGKAAVFYAPAWDFASNLHGELEHLGYTEGEVRVTMNETYNALTLPEYTGDAPHKEFVQGEAPEITLPLYVADPALRAILSPTGNAAGGYRRQLPVAEYTLALIPEEIFLDLGDPTRQTDLTLVPTGTGWQLGGDDLTDEQEAKLGQSAWFWRVRFGKPDLLYRHEDGGKVVADVTARVLYQVRAPNGHRLYTLGDPYAADIDILTGFSES